MVWGKKKAEQCKTDYFKDFRIFRKVHGPVTCREAVVHHLRAVHGVMDGVLSHTLGHLIFLSKVFFLLFFLRGTILFKSYPFKNPKIKKYGAAL